MTGGRSQGRAPLRSQGIRHAGSASLSYTCGSECQCEPIRTGGYDGNRTGASGVYSLKDGPGREFRKPLAAQSLINAEARESARDAQPRFLSWIGPSWLYALAIFLNAFLLFQVQPLIGKIILPWFGGAAAVWTVCLLFFQVALLLGYLYAHVLTRSVGPRMQSRIHVGLLALSLLVLPILPRETWKPTGSGDPSWRILLLLTLTVGLPYFLLSSTSPLLQSWYARSRAGAVPYRFYALSNFGSMLALVSYPALIEPKLTSTHQAVLWSAIYVAAAVVCAIVTFGNSPNTWARTEARAGSDDGTRPQLSDKLMWMALAGCGSALLVAITTHVTQNVASVPLLWVIPLALYLLSFILCFDSSFWYRRGVFLRLLSVALACMAYALSPSFAVLPLGLLVGLYCCGLFVCCMFCHGELVRLKPHPAHLTSFYLLISFGSALGAFFAALLAPRIFAGHFELQIALGLCAVLVPIVYRRDPKSRLYRARWQPGWIALLGLTVALVAGLISTAVEQSAQARVMVRNFYGVLSVVDQPGREAVRLQSTTANEASERLRSRKLMNGSIDHGMQWLSPMRRREPTAYYAADSGIGIALRAAGEQRAALRVGVIGLGVGTLASYGRPGDHYSFYEINPLVARLARDEFSYIRDSAAQVEIVLGDGRLSLEREPSRQYDVLAVDAFSGDSIPVHMLTRQAFALYFEHLQPTGVLAVHISNTYLNLLPVVQAAATALHKQAVVIDNPGDRAHGVFRSTWVLLGNGGGYLGQQEIESAGKRLPRAAGQLWTDDFSSLFSILD